MAIDSVKKIGAGRKGSGKTDSRSYVVVWWVIVNSPYDGPCTVANAPGLPLRYAPYVGYENTNDPAALCTGLDVEQDGDEWPRWRVTATFDTNWNQSNQESQQENPEDDPVLFWIETEFQNRKTTKTWDGQDIKNSAGQLIDGLEKILAIETWVWERNYISVNRDVWTAYQNAVNSLPFEGIETKEGLLHIIVPKPSVRNGIPFVRVQFRIKINKDKWTVEPADRGTGVKGTDGKLYRPVDAAGHPFDGEVPLKADGTQEKEAFADPRYIKPPRDIYEPKNFYNLGFA